MAEQKKCPKCTSTMHKSEFTVFIHAMGDEKHGTSGTLTYPKAGVPLEMHECPSCHLVEFYHEE